VGLNVGGLNVGDGVNLPVPCLDVKRKTPLDTAVAGAVAGVAPPTARLLTEIAIELDPKELSAPADAVPTIRCCCDHIEFLVTNTYTLPAVLTWDTLVEMASRPLVTVIFCPNPTSPADPRSVWLTVQEDPKPPTRGEQKKTTEPAFAGLVTAIERRVLATRTPKPKVLLAEGGDPTPAGLLKTCCTI